MCGVGRLPRTYRVERSTPVIGVLGLLWCIYNLGYHTGWIVWGPYFHIDAFSITDPRLRWAVLLAFIGCLWLALIGLIVRVTLSDAGMQYRGVFGSTMITWSDVKQARIIGRLGGFSIATSSRRLSIGYRFRRHSEMKDSIAQQICLHAPSALLERAEG
jgi:hypothetical protein